MILVTGGTGFIGKALIRHLAEMDLPVRTLVRPSPHSPELPHGVPVEVTVTALNDPRGLRAAMVGVDTVYHLAGSEWSGARGSLMDVDIYGTRAVVEAAVDAGIDRIFFVSHLGADRASAYPVLKAKAIAEEFVRRSGLDYTIIRSAIAYGPGDGLTTGLARLVNALPYLFFMPGDGSALVQPIWVEDLATCLSWALDDSDTRNQMYEIGGPEYFTFSQILDMVMEATGERRFKVPMRPIFLRWMTMLLESLFPHLPSSVYWLDYLAVNRTCPLDTAPRIFHLLPARMAYRLDYLRDQSWRTPLLRSPFRRV